MLQRVWVNIPIDLHWQIIDHLCLFDYLRWCRTCPAAYTYWRHDPQIALLREGRCGPKYTLKLAERAIGKRYVRPIEWLIRYKYGSFEKMMRYAARHRWHALIALLRAMDPVCREVTKMELYGAAESGDPIYFASVYGRLSKAVLLEVTKAEINPETKPIWKSLCRSFTLPEVIGWCQRLRDDGQTNEGQPSIQHALSYKRLDVAQWILSTMTHLARKEQVFLCMEHATRHGNTLLLEGVQEMCGFNPTAADVSQRDRMVRSCIRGFCYGGHLIEMAQLLNDELFGDTAFFYQVFVIAARKGHLAILHYLQCHRLFGLQDRLSICYAACRGDQLEVLRTYLPTCSDAFMPSQRDDLFSWASRNGSMDTFQYLSTLYGTAFTVGQVLASTASYGAKDIALHLVTSSIYEVPHKVAFQCACWIDLPDVAVRLFPNLHMDDVLSTLPKTISRGHLRVLHRLYRVITRPEDRLTLLNACADYDGVKDAILAETEPKLQTQQFDRERWLGLVRIFIE